MTDEDSDDLFNWDYPPFPAMRRSRRAWLVGYDGLRSAGSSHKAGAFSSTARGAWLAFWDRASNRR